MSVGMQTGKRASRLLQLNAWIVFAFFYIPIVVLVVFSFNDSARVNIWGGLSTRWYPELLNNDQILSALKNSLIIAAISTVVSTILGTSLAIALDRYRFKGRKTLDGVAYLPVIIPDVTMAVMMLAFFAQAFRLINNLGPNLQLGLYSVAISHIAFNISFVAIVVRARLGQLNPSLEEAARDLYASRWLAFRLVTLPLIMPGVLAGALLALALSLDDVVISAFVTGPGGTTLPVYVFSAIRRGVTPELNAISTIMLAVSTTLVLSSLFLQRAPKSDESVEKGET
jgi:spermidine/putrescine transport system permease protein